MSLIAPIIADSGVGRIVVFFPHAGGSPRFFRHLAEALPRHRVYGVTYPGRDHLIEQPPITDLHLLAERVAGELATQFGDHPRLGDDAPLLVGHSLGAFVAYETAVALRRRSAAAVVVASGQNPPRPDQTGHEGSGALSDEELIADVIRQNPASEPVWRDPELRAFFLPTVRADYRLLGSYRPSGGRIDEVRVVVGGSDQEVDRANLGEWRQFSDRAGDVTVLEGGHFYLERPDTRLARFVDRLTSSAATAGGIHA